MNTTMYCTIFKRLILVMGFCLAGCNGNPVRDPDYAPVRPVLPPPAPQGDGALYHGGYSMNWFEDLRALNVGDILTVRLNESTNASKDATTTAKKTNDNRVSTPTLLGVVPKLISGANTGGNLFTTSSEHEFKGDGSSSQNNALTGDISVTVIEVLPNGYLSIRGEKRIGINQGNEYIKLAGLVRPYDVGPDNTVSSTKIADPTIVYVGDNAVADSNVVGWLSRFFMGALMPF